MRPMLVVVGDVVADEAFDLSAVPDDGAVEKLSPDRADPALGNVFAAGVRTGVRRIFKPSVGKISSKESMNWLPRSRTSARVPARWSPWRRNRLRAAWVVQAPVGFAVTLAKNTCRVSTWMKNST